MGLYLLFATDQAGASTSKSTVSLHSNYSYIKLHVKIYNSTDFGHLLEI